MEDKIKNNWLKNLFYPALFVFGGLFVLLKVERNDEFGKWFNMVLGGVMLLFGLIFIWALWYGRRRALQHYHNLLWNYPELKENFDLLYSESRYSRQHTSLYLYKEAIVIAAADFRFLLLDDLTELSVQIVQISERKYVKRDHLYLGYKSQSHPKGQSYDVGYYLDQKYIELLEFLDVVHQAAPHIQIRNKLAGE